MSKTKEKGKASSNSIELTLHVIGGKWKMQIIWLLRENEKRYGELKKSIPTITHKMLTQQLRELENDDLIIRKDYKQVPPKVDYSLSLLGKSTLPVIEMLKEWGDEYKKLFD